MEDWLVNFFKLNLILQISFTNLVLRHYIAGLLQVYLKWFILITQVFAASSAGFQCTGYEINSILVAYAKNKARWIGVPETQATFVKKDFWKVGLCIKNCSLSA